MDPHDLEVLTDRWGATRVENAMIFITQAEDRNGLKVCIPTTKERVGAVLEAVYGEYEPEDAVPVSLTG